MENTHIYCVGIIQIFLTLKGLVNISTTVLLRITYYQVIALLRRLPEGLC